MNEHKVGNWFGGILGSLISFAGCTSESLENMDHIFSIVCGVVGVIITVVTCVILPLIKKIKAAKADGKITDDEIKDIEKTLEDGLKETKDKIDDINKKP